MKIGWTLITKEAFIVINLDSKEQQKKFMEESPVANRDSMVGRYLRLFIKAYKCGDRDTWVVTPQRAVPIRSSETIFQISRPFLTVLPFVNVTKSCGFSCIGRWTLSFEFNLFNYIPLISQLYASGFIGDLLGFNSQSVMKRLTCIVVRMISTTTTSCTM